MDTERQRATPRAPPGHVGGAAPRRSGARSRLVFFLLVNKVGYLQWIDIFKLSDKEQKRVLTYLQIVAFSKSIHSIDLQSRKRHMAAMVVVGEKVDICQDTHCGSIKITRIASARHAQMK